MQEDYWLRLENISNEMLISKKATTDIVAFYISIVIIYSNSRFRNFPVRLFLDFTISSGVP
mgnify:CR=1 FL=1